MNEYRFPSQEAIEGIVTLKNFPFLLNLELNADLDFYDRNGTKHYGRLSAITADTVTFFSHDDREYHTFKLVR